MLGKWFKRKSVPDNDGSQGSESVGRTQFVKVFELELSNMEDSPVYPLTNQLTIGSEIGNIIISDPSISPRHASFVLQDEVVSLMDHGSVSGTFINNKKIDPGKNIILEETDVIRIGELEVRLKVGREEVPAEEVPEAPAEPVEKPAPKSQPKPQSQIKSAKSSISIPKKYTSKSKGINFRSPESSTNALIRVFAVTSDFILAYAILTVFMPFDEFRMILEEIPVQLAALAGDLDLESIIALAGEDLAFVKDMLKDGYDFISSTFHVIPILIVFVLIRLLSTLLFGVSLSELFFGVRPTGNKIWSRIGGVLRVIVGLFTWPFLIFDLPSLFSRRTFKEIITFTNTQVPSKFMAILGFIFYIPLLIVVCAIAPLAEGLEFPQAIVINDRIDQRVKVKVAAPEAGAVETELVNDQSQKLNLELSYNNSELQIFPNFKFQGVKSKLNVKNGLIFYQRDLQVPVELEIMKTFNLKQLLGFGMKGNVFIHDRYPEIYNFVFEPDDLNIAFKKNQNAKVHQKFANEVIEFTKTAFALDLETAIDFVQEQSPMLKGYVDYRSSFLALIEYKDFDQIGFIKIGNVIFMRIEYSKQKPFDLLIPLIKGPGRVFKVTYSKKENAKESATKFLKFNLEKSDWFPEAKKEVGEVMSPLQVYDAFSQENLKTFFQSASRAQSLYAYFYETSSAVIKKGDPVELDIWKTKVINTLNLVEKLPDVPAEGEENVRPKLLQNLRDTVDALEHNNAEYFGITHTSI